MVTAEAALNVVGIVISFGLILSPVPTFYKIIEKKSVEEFKPDPYIATMLNCMCRIFYRLPFVHPDSLLVITINGCGLVLELIYLAIFFAYADKKGRKKISLCLMSQLKYVAIAILMLAIASKKSLVYYAIK